MDIYNLVEKYASQPEPWFDFEPIQSDMIFDDNEDLYEDAKLTRWGGITPTSWEKGHKPWNKNKRCSYISKSKKAYWEEWKKKNPDHIEKRKKYVKVGFDSQTRSERVKKLNEKKATCPYCNKVGQLANMKRWHFEKCRHKS